MCIKPRGFQTIQYFPWIILSYTFIFGNLGTTLGLVAGVGVEIYVCGKRTLNAAKV